MRNKRENEKKMIFLSFHGSLFPINFQMNGRRTTSDESPKSNAQSVSCNVFLFDPSNKAR